jgi:hypothetical protein
MKNLSTNPFISRAIIPLVLGLIVAQFLVVTGPVFAAPKMSPKMMISKLPQGPSSQWWLFCWYFYVDETDKTSQVSDMQACQYQNTYFARVVTVDNAMQWPVKKLDQLNLPGMSSASQLQDKLESVFKNQEVLSDSAVVPDLFDYELSDAVNDITKSDPDMQMAGTPPATVLDAFTVFCKQEQTNGVITDVTSCQKLATPFMDDNVLSMFETSDTNPDVQAVTEAWLAGNSLQVMALQADSGVMENDWMDTLQTAIGPNSNLMTLMSNQDFMDDLWMWAPMPLLGADMG